MHLYSHRLGLASAAVLACAATLAPSAALAAAGPADQTRPVIAYVANSASGSVTPIRTATNTALKAIDVGGAIAIAITPNGKTAYVVNGISCGLRPR